MTERTLTGAVAKLGMHDLSNVASLVEIQPEATVSRTVLQAEGARVVLFSFDAGQVLTEHTAAVPVLLQVLDGHLRITADGRTVDLRPGGPNTSMPTWSTRTSTARSCATCSTSAARSTTPAARSPSPWTGPTAPASPAPSSCSPRNSTPPLPLCREIAAR
jgi:hypothetical protein